MVEDFRRIGWGVNNCVDIKLEISTVQLKSNFVAQSDEAIGVHLQVLLAQQQQMRLSIAANYLHDAAADVDEVCGVDV